MAYAPKAGKSKPAHAPRGGKSAAIHKPASPAGGRSLSVSGGLSRQIWQGFGLDASQLQFRESDELERMDALATTQGNVIRFAPGQYRPGTAEGRQVLGHELNHVVQQAGGGVRADVPGANVNADPALERASDAAGAGFAAGTLAAASPVALGGGGAAGAPVQGIFGMNRRKREKQAKQRRADTLRAGVGTFNARSSSVRQGLAANVRARGGVPNEENTAVGSISRSAQSMMIPGNESYNAQVTDYFKNSGHTFDSGANTFSAQGLADPQHVARFKALMKPHVDFVMNSNITSIDTSDPESLRNNMQLLARAGMINQFVGDARKQIPDLAGSEAQTNEFYNRLHFANNAFTIARAQVAKEQGYKDDPSLYTEADYSGALESRVDRNEVNIEKAKPSDKVKKYRKDRMQANTERRVQTSNTLLHGQSTYQGYMQEKTRRDQQRQPGNAPNTAPAPTTGPTTAPAPTTGPTTAPAPTTGPTTAPAPTTGPTTAPAPTTGPTTAPAPTTGPTTAPAPTTAPSGGGMVDPTSPDFKPSPQMLARLQQQNRQFGRFGQSSIPTTAPAPTTGPTTAPAPTTGPSGGGMVNPTSPDFKPTPQMLARLRQGNRQFGMFGQMSIPK